MGGVARGCRAIRSSPGLDAPSRSGRDARRLRDEHGRPPYSAIVQTIAGAEHLDLIRHRSGEERALQRAAARGEVTRLRSGAYVSTAIWRTLAPEDRRRLEVVAMARMHSGFVASHRSAAALWRIPTVQRPDGLVHARVTLAAGSRTEHGVRKHAVRDVDQHLTTVAGVLCTDFERTALDLAATEPFPEAVAALDWVLARGVGKERLQEVLDEWAPSRGRRRVEEALAFADPASGSPGESVSRVRIHQDGFPPPVLQQAFFDGAGLIGYVDFWWPDVGVIGEFDGLKKYREAELLARRSPGEVVVAEKIREDRLRATPTHPVVVRWIWAELQTPGALANRLTQAGLRRVR